MGVSYDRLFHMMIDRKITNAQLMNMCGFSANIITRLKKDEYISLESVEKICRTLDCGVDDILNFIPVKESRRRKFAVWRKKTRCRTAGRTCHMRIFLKHAEN